MPLRQDSDNALMLRAKDDDKEAFREIFQRYHKEIVGFFYRHQHSHDQQLAEEHSQDVFLRLWRSRKKYKATGSFRSYLFSIAINLWKDQCRREKKTIKVISLDSSKTVAGGEKVPLQVADRTAINPYEALLRKEENALIEKAIDSLPEEQKEVFLLKHYHGLSYAEISKALGCPAGTVYSRTNLALRKLAARLKELKEK